MEINPDQDLISLASPPNPQQQQDHNAAQAVTKSPTSNAVIQPRPGGLTVEELMKMSHWKHVGSSWKGFDALGYLFVFGASYCQVGYYGLRSPLPSVSEPLGVEFPGDTYNEPGEPNWVGFLARDFRPKDKDGVEKPLLVFDYAIGGQMVDGVRIQVERAFLPHVGQKPEWAPWTPNDSLFSIWIGINDISYGWLPKPAVENLYEVLSTLFKAGARNFLLIDVPPMNRSPARTSSLPKKFTEGLKSSQPYDTWNDELRSQGEDFTKSHPDASVFIFSAYDLFDSVLDDPTRFGFALEDASKRGGAIWFDHIHPTSKMHRIIAQSLVDYLKSVPERTADSSEVDTEESDSN